jgi:hypothetical protein
MATLTRHKPLHRRTRRRLTLGSATAVVFALAGVIIPATQAASPAHASPDAAAACTAPAVTSTSGSSFAATETLCRTYFDKGVVDQRDIQVNVSDTTGLRNGQVVSVSWSGAHPTGGLISDEQFSSAAQQEYPVVLMECRGVNTASTPLSPDTCWSASVMERRATSPSVAPIGGKAYPISPMWNLDSYNPPSEQGTAVNVPNPLPKACGRLQPYEYWLPFVAADGTKYAIGPQGCAGSPPEMLTNTENPGIAPSDTTYAETAPNGDGSAKFTIETSETNASLGCSQTVACSLVIVPIEGISCNANPTIPGQPQYSCENSGNFTAGELNIGQNPYGPALSDTGTFWWSQSNWQRRISVPLNFTTPADACNQNSAAPLEFYGSELMAQATEQWDPYFCLNPKLFNVQQVQISEPQAKESVQQGEIEAAIEGAPPPVTQGQSSFFTKPTVQAPIGVTGFAIAYVIDNGNGTPYTQLKLDPRLLAKLLTESYYGTNNIQSGDAGIAHNPQSIFDDPEFVALNPGFSPPGGIQPAPAATLFSILTRSDVIWSLTSYINDDPEARAWLNGQPDPWGMNVNPAYKGIQLPVESWPTLDTSTNGPDYTISGNPFCVGALGTGKAKEPDRPLIDNPQDTLANVAYNLEYSIAASLVTCNNDSITPSYLELGPEVLGSRFLIGLVSLPAADQLDLDTAALQTYASPEAETPDLKSFSSGRVFVSPSTSSLQAGASLLQPDPAAGSWVVPYGDFPGQSAAKQAYPGTMLMSVDVPTTGLPASDAAHYGQYLGFAATTGQTSGSATGQIPQGYLPLTAGNGLAQEVAYTQAAANDVSTQNGQVPPLHSSGQSTGGSSTSGSSSLTSAGSTSDNFSATGESGSSGGSGTSGTSSGQGPGGSSGNGTGSPSKSSGLYPSQIEPAASVGRTVGFGSGLGGLALGLAMFIALTGACAGGVLWWRRRGAIQP